MDQNSLVAVDPGLHQCGVALWQNGRLVWADLVRNPDSVPGQGALCAREMGFAVGESVRPYTPKRLISGALPLVIEVPQVYTRGRGGDPNDLIDLACVVGAVMANFNGAIYTYRPAQWKGQVPKEVCHARARARLTPEEIAIVAANCPPSLAHNVWDAVALGLAHKAKFAVLR
jgi:hypothetical protein